MPPDNSTSASSVPATAGSVPTTSTSDHTPLPLGNSNDPFAFVIIPHPSIGTDEVFKKQVRRHVAYRWHEDARRRSNRIASAGPRVLAPKSSDLTEIRRIESFEYKSTITRLTGSTAFTSTPEHHENEIFALTSPNPGLSPVTHIGGGRRDPFNSCAIRCNTMESFLLDHYFQTFAAKVSAIFTPAEYSEFQLQVMPREWVSFLVTDAGILAGVFLRACRTLSVVTSKQYLDKLALKYKARCIESLSTKIASMDTALSVEAIAMMLMLTTDEFYMGSAETMRYHVDAMQRVVRLKGGLQGTALERIVLRLIEWNDLQCTLLSQNEGPRKYPAVDILTSGFPVYS